ncbi:MAG: hypothetical protein GTO42_01420 [Candidatus Latescibacteria bacterium]|nr:hypothetical protein [Candidatus Latescibacterota bacterium]NIO27189.1 hypothetical protein [Candidatus Latescibacterota bacterium]NIO54713.1 hypothetical protein [Candidatus Latescibacterota bacterium]NIT00796.1 hypothetical protein [Candidatus Latescibacterota bacterium]NIT37719.1 hypothetical protein [Candidatus Latescibacterota bacterium]
MPIKSTILKLFLIFIISALVFPPEAMAWDGQRKGFILGMSIGTGMTHVRTNLGHTSRNVTRGALALNCRIGYSTDNRTQIYYFQKMSIFRLPELGQAYEDWFDTAGEESFKGILYMVITPLALPFIPIKASHSMIGLALNYHLEEKAPSFFLGGGLGLTLIADPIEEDLLSDDANVVGGFGFIANAGYEFSPHYSVEFQFIFGTGSEGGFAGGGSRNAYTLLVTLNALGY